MFVVLFFLFDYWVCNIVIGFVGVVVIGVLVMVIGVWLWRVC